MRHVLERSLIKILKAINSNLLAHAHVQIGVGHNTYVSGEEAVVHKFLVEILDRKPQVIFDIGANIGEYAKLLATHFKSAKIYCFEPVPANYEQLVKTTEGLKTVNVLSAMGSEKGTIKLYIGDNNTDGSMATSYRETLETIFAFAGEVNQMVESPVTTVDDYCGGAIDKIDFLKIDVEGHELQVLKGAADMISKNNISVVQFEFNEFNIFSRSFMFDFYQVLNAYDFYRIMPQSRLFPMGKYDSSLEIFRYQNILAVNKSLNYVYK